ncbi:MAG: hypothetical protein J6S30_01635, partial [Kiritimatiellae bacterium]|nr:hypothetical protein [Kiritimatiellia bacterium]
MESIASRRSFVQSVGAAFAVSLAPRFVLSAPSSKAGAKGIDYAALQADIDNVTPRDYSKYHSKEFFWELQKKFPTLKRLEDSFDKVLKEVKSTRVTYPNRPAIWYVYNMGFIVKTKKSLF